MFSGGQILQPEVLPQPQQFSRRNSGTVVITEQPAPHGIRFRYACEGRLETLTGVNSTPEHKTFPSIQILGYTGRATVVVSCVTKDFPYKPHPHKLLGRGCKKGGVCALDVPMDTMSVTFDNLKVLCIKRKKVSAALQEREQVAVDPFKTGFGHRAGSSKIDLNCIRLCFQVFIEDRRTGRCTVQLAPVVSEPFFDKKAVPDLSIIKMCSCTTTCAGGPRGTLLLICAKVYKDDIKIRFFEEQDGVIVWEDYGEFESSEVYKGVAIAFRPPRYRSQNIDEPINCYVQLVRPSNNDRSEPLPFQFIPMPEYNISERKRRKLSSLLFQNLTSAAVDVPPNYSLPTQQLPPNEYIQQSNIPFTEWSFSLPPCTSTDIDSLLPLPDEELQPIHISSGDLESGGITLSETFQQNLSLTDHINDNMVFESNQQFYVLK